MVFQFRTACSKDSSISSISTDNFSHSKQTSKQLLHHSSNYYSLSRSSQNLSRKNSAKVQRIYLRLISAFSKLFKLSEIRKEHEKRKKKQAKSRTCPRIQRRLKRSRISVGRATPGRQSQPVPSFDVDPLCPPDPFKSLFLTLGSPGTRWPSLDVH